MDNFNDVIGGANLYNGLNYAYVPDRFNNPNSAIYLQKGYLQVPAGVYFSGDFTITAWVEFNSTQYYQRIIDFNNINSDGVPSDNVIFCLKRMSLNLFINTFFSYKKLDYVVPSRLNLKQWYHLAYVLQGKTGTVYVDGVNVGSGPQNSPNNVTRYNNFIGKSWSSGDALADATYDDIKIYKGALQASDILNDYTSSLVNRKQ